MENEISIHTSKQAHLMWGRASKWSNGPVEAQVNCLKLQKRLMFGRANFDLLRLHVLLRA
jgi:transposase